MVKTLFCALRSIVLAIGHYGYWIVLQRFHKCPQKSTQALVSLYLKMLLSSEIQTRRSLFYEPNICAPFSLQRLCPKNAQSQKRLEEVELPYRDITITLILVNARSLFLVVVPTRMKITS